MWEAKHSEGLTLYSLLKLAGKLARTKNVSEREKKIEKYLAVKINSEIQKITLVRAHI